MSDNIPTVTHESVLRVGGLELRALNLSDGSRVIPEDDFRRFMEWLETGHLTAEEIREVEATIKNDNEPKGLLGGEA